MSRKYICLLNPLNVMLKVHLGCGSKKIPGWVNVDCNPLVEPDVLNDIKTLEYFEDGSVDVIYACHVLEHVGRWEWKRVLAIWIGKLKPGGVLRLAVPSFKAVVDWYVKTNNINDVMGLVCGGQKNEHDYHYVIFDNETLTAALLALGMSEVREWDWKTTEHAFIDDYSQAYLPHMDKEHGVNVSLNLEALKGMC